MVVFVILTTCAHVYFENTMLDIDTETRSVIYGIGIHTVSSYQHNIAWFKFRGADPQFTVRYYLINKNHIFKGHENWQNLHRRFDAHYISSIDDEDFIIFCGLPRKQEPTNLRK